jgi:glycosyltransferase involved in cell wall biosynthesis
MKILFITHGADMMGANRCLLDLMESLASHGVISTVLLPADGAFRNALDERGITSIISSFNRIAYTRYISKGYWVGSSMVKKNKDLLVEIKSKLQGLSFDMIYSNTSIIDIGALLARELNLPHVWHIREFGEKDYDLSFVYGRKYFNSLANEAAAIISMSKAIDDEVLQQVQSPKYVLHDGIITRERLASITPRQAAANKDFTFLIIGLLHPTKGQFTALKAFHNLLKSGQQNIRLIIAGEGRRLYTRQMKAYIKRHKLEHYVEMPGYVKNPFEVHKRADALLMCSRSEGMGRVTLEAMICGNPVIGYNGGATPELIVNGKDGIIYNSPDDLVMAMKTLANDPEKSFQMGKAGRTKIEQSYTLEEYGVKIYNILRSIKK